MLIHSRRWLIAGFVTFGLVVSCSAYEQVDKNVGERTDTLKVAASVSKGWVGELTAPDATRRKEAVQSAQVADVPDAAAKLEKVIGEDPSPEVREVAVLAYTELKQQQAVAFLRKVALTSKEAQVVNAAHASLHDLRAQAPKRGFLDADFPPSFSPGKAFPVKVRFGSSSAVKQAQVSITLPEPLQTADGSEPRWVGSIPAGVTQELTFMLVAGSAQTKSGTLVSLKLDYAEELDFEVFDQHLRVSVDGLGGQFSSASPSVREMVVGK